MKFKESEKVELKKSTAELKEVLNDLCAFANSGIGTIYFGISDKGKNELAYEGIWHGSPGI